MRSIHGQLNLLFIIFAVILFLTIFLIFYYEQLEICQDHGFDKQHFRSLYLNALLFGGLFLLLFSTGIFLLTKRVLSPLLRFTELVENSGNIPETAIKRGYHTRELHNLIDAYNKLAQRVRENTTDLEKMVEERTEQLQRTNIQLKKSNARLNEKTQNLYHISVTDELTGLYNRTELIQRMEYILEELRAGISRQCTMLFMDLDNFKYYNDHFGHDAGDRILQFMSHLFQTTLRDRDFISRYGGDEFIVLLPGQDQAQASIVKEKLCAALNDALTHIEQSAQNEDITFPDVPPDKRLGLSVGVYTFTFNEHMGIEEMLKEADDLMYQQKKEKKKNR